MTKSPETLILSASYFEGAAPRVEASNLAYQVTLIRGDGTGPELVEATRRVLEGTGVAFEWDVVEAGASTGSCDNSRSTYHELSS